MFATGYPSLVILRVFNNTENFIENIEIFYKNNGNITSISIKNLKPNKSKQTGLSTINANNNDLIMSILDKSYVLKKSINKDYKRTLIININDIDLNSDIKFTVREEE